MDFSLQYHGFGGARTLPFDADVSTVRTLAAKNLHHFGYVVGQWHRVGIGRLPGTGQFCFGLAGSCDAVAA